MQLDDPFSLAYDAIWDLVEASEHVTKLVKLKNRIKLHEGNPVIDKPSVMDADLPEITLMLNGGGGNLYATSSASHFTRSFAWMITTGQSTVNTRILPVEWALIRALKPWPVKAGQLLWNDKPYIHSTRIDSITEGISDPDRNRGIKGWSALMSITLDMTFTTEDL